MSITGMIHHHLIYSFEIQNGWRRAVFVVIFLFPRSSMERNSFEGQERTLFIDECNYMIHFPTLYISMRCKKHSTLVHVSLFLHQSTWLHPLSQSSSPSLLILLYTYIYVLTWIDVFLLDRFLVYMTRLRGESDLPSVSKCDTFFLSLS